MSNPNPGSSAGGIGPGPSEAPPDESGMDVETAVESAFNDWDEKEHGISEASRTEWGPELKKIADHEGTNVRDGINTLVASHINKRYGNNEIKRQAIGADIDAYQINALPTAEAAPQGVNHGFTDTGPVIQNEEQAHTAIQDFVAANPAAQDAAIQERMIEVASDMRAQGYEPHLGTMFQHAVQADPRFNEGVRRAQQNDEVARAKAASVQVTGGGNSIGAAPKSDDIGAILNELI